MRWFIKYIDSWTKTHTHTNISYEVLTSDLPQDNTSQGNLFSFTNIEEPRLVCLGISTLDVKKMDEKLEGEAEGSQEEEEPNYGLVFKESFSFWKDQGPTEADGWVSTLHK